MILCVCGQCLWSVFVVRINLMILCVCGRYLWRAHIICVVIVCCVRQLDDPVRVCSVFVERTHYLCGHCLLCVSIG